MIRKPNKAIHFADGVTVIALERKNGDVFSCYIDAVSWPLVCSHRWRANKNKHSKTFYAVTHVRKADGTRTNLQMHRLLMPDVSEVDHANRNGLDNRRDNLRAATSSQNGANKEMHRDNTSGFKGVFWNKAKWNAHVRFNNKSVYLGRFDDPVEAARAYDAKALELFGEFARLNFPKAA